MAIPIALTGADVIGQARTGTGKTLAFGVPLLQRIITPRDRGYANLDAPGKPQALVVTPTRELALQVADDIATAGALREVRVLTVYGGVAYEPQLAGLQEGADVVVGTPGRLLDLADRQALELSHVKILVLDEADRMLDLGFLPDVERLIKLTHEMRQTMLFSATMPGEVIQLARRHMRHPVNVRAEAADESQVVPATAQFVYRCHELDKPEVLARVLQAESRGRVMVFCTTKRSAQRVADDLAERGFAATAIHGDMGQIARERALQKFRDGKVDVLVATDVAARGIDVEGVTHVVNYTCPDDDKTYLHRIGRTGRAGASGIAVTFVDWPDVPRWKTINTALQLPFDEPVETYSTSGHLYHDLGIPKDAGSRVGPPATRPGRGRRQERARGSRRPTSGATQAAESAPRGESKHRRKRVRRRRGAEQPVEPAAKATYAADPSSAPSGDRASVDPTTDHPGEATTQPRRRRRRRLRRGVVVADRGSDVAATTGASDAGRESADTQRHAGPGPEAADKAGDAVATATDAGPAPTHAVATVDAPDRQGSTDQSGSDEGQPAAGQRIGRLRRRLRFRWRWRAKDEK
ncbi:MAG TPA: DEAD/DEAH box helicase [Actinopolymorphaceae bacterium]|jgi:superfamily II DNA/RNA helicase